MEWGGNYWGPEGAIVLKERYLTDLNLSPVSLHDVIFRHATLGSLHYSAAGSAVAKVREILRRKQVLKIWQLPMWARRSCSEIRKAWDQTCQARYIFQNVPGASGKFSADQFDVFQSIARKWYLIRFWNPFGERGRELGEILELVQDFTLQGQCTDECSHITKCLLNIGYADFLDLKSTSANRERIRTHIFDTLIGVWDTAQKIVEDNPDEQTCRQLVRVFRHLADMSGELVPFSFDIPRLNRLSGPTSALELHEESKLMRDKYLEKGGSADQSLKAGV